MDATPPAPDPDDAWRALQPALHEAGRRMEAVPSDQRRERAFADFLKAALGARLGSSGLAVSTEGRVELKEWPDVGRVDLVLSTTAGQRILLGELKWGGSALYNCAWDMAKLAQCLAEQPAPYAVLVAGARHTDWESLTPGAQLFESRAWQLEELLKMFAYEFAFWREDVKTYPRKLPVQWDVSAIADIPFDLGGEGWAIKASRVQVSISDLARVHYVPEIRHRRRPTRVRR